MSGTEVQNPLVTGPYRQLSATRSSTKVKSSWKEGKHIQVLSCEIPIRRKSSKYTTPKKQMRLRMTFVTMAMVIPILAVLASSDTGKGKPTAKLTASPDGHVLIGDTVTLTCEIECHSDWTYKWYKDTNQTRLPCYEHTYTITGAAGSDKGQYWCQGERKHNPKTSNTRLETHKSTEREREREHNQRTDICSMICFRFQRS
ncbi:hypothetical protein AALO_G00227280 [Alosa alosa]|uniref:Ig-like domain-containing protein n=1 Tax=Alosa alosa TaxID=278164 RepID=A0AAV6G346_9TELE|nr:hypothetical protein AALO_G00227280 [Alosa alosa]